ncbi:MAG: hypothetical protein NTX79_07310 [Candidatus Micrarchaeota archaeon]|nr:hypothetical protein [Candidatus Micrarchaeota archaeon]
MKISKEKLGANFQRNLSILEYRNSNLMKKGNESLAAGGLLALGAAACPAGPCPACIGPSLLFLINGIREKLG